MTFGTATSQDKAPQSQLVLLLLISLTLDGCTNSHLGKEKPIEWQRAAKGLLPLTSEARQPKTMQALCTCLIEE